MSPRNLVTVNTHYTRSINLERDLGSAEAISAYIPTSRALRTSERVSDAFGSGVAPRAWSLVGPYGSGKSSYALFLSELLQDPKGKNTQIAQGIFSRADSELSDKFSQHIEGSSGYVRVLITGGPEPLGARIIEGLAEAAREAYSAKKGRKPQIVERLQAALHSPEPIVSSDLLAMLTAFQKQLMASGYRGIILVIDELGKFLEYEARHYGTNDIFLLQSLAELACAGGEAKLFLFVLLHQSFEQYAKGLGESLKKEWSKIQGRFEEIPFVESSEQVMRIVSAAFIQNISKKDKTQLRKKVSSTVQTLEKQSALPPGLKKSHAINLFSDCYPLHPLTSLLLPALCQKVAQNERTLFSYLGSHEEHGLQDALQSLDSIDQYVYPHDIYDYFVTNQPAVLGDYITHRRWAEVVTAIERIGDAEPRTVELLKTIGILNIIGGKGGFKASKEVLATIFTDSTALEKSIRSLQNSSVITFRKFSGEYRVWQGSDFDLESALGEWTSNLGQYSLAEELTKSSQLRPIIARRYAVKTGTLRYFDPVFIDASTYSDLVDSQKTPRILFYLAGAKDDKELFKDKVLPHFSSTNNVVVLCMNGAQLREAMTEALALDKVGHSFQELKADPVAKREYEDRKSAADSSLDVSVQSLVDTPQEHSWYFQGDRLPIKSKRDLQAQLSCLMEKIYSEAPIVKNELINREKPSSQANAGRNKLLSAMITSPGKEDLGIEKYPAEKALYRSILKETGLHQLVDADGDQWAFSAPPAKKSDKTNMRPVWERIDKFLDSTEAAPKSFADLNAELIAPPYGVKVGLLPLLYITAFQFYKDELALYENRRYVPGFTNEMLERFVKRPDEYTVERFKIDGLKASILKEYAQVIVFDNPANATVLGFASQLAKFFGSLPEYTKKTRRGLSSRAVDVRTEFNLAKSPEKLIFSRLPVILGFEEVSKDATSDDAESFSYALKSVLGELENAYPKMIDRQRELLAKAFGKSPRKSLQKLRREISDDCSGLEEYTIDRVFIDQVNSRLENDEMWFEKLLAFLGHKKTSKWSDVDQDTAEYRLATYARKLVDLQKLKDFESEPQSHVSQGREVYLLRSIKKKGAIYDRVVSIDSQAEDAGAVEGALLEIKKVLGNLEDDSARLAAVAKFTNDFLSRLEKADDELDVDVTTEAQGRKAVLKGNG